MAKPPREYAIGKGRPPTETQFKPGQSGNPSGRPKGRQNLKEILRVAAADVVSIKENGEEKEITKLEIIAKVLVNNAAKGDHRSIKLVMDYYPECSSHSELDSDEVPKITSDMSPAEAAALYERQRKKSGS